MISNRSYLAMTVMMLILLFLFMATQVVSDDKDVYSRNNYYDSYYEKVNMENADEEQIVLTSLPEQSDTGIVVFVGPQDSEAAETVSSWCQYSRKKIYFLQTAEELLQENLSSTELVVISPDVIKVAEITRLQRLAETGISILFYEMPEEDTVEHLKYYQELFGIQEIVETETELEGVKLFSGFLLGGEVIYQEDEDFEKENHMQDLNLTIPWYKVNRGTETYMVGLVDEDKYGGEEEVENEDLPPVIWRTSHGDGFVFAVNGDYFSGVTGMGILNGIMTSLQTYYLYPVVNAQNITVVDFPGMANENEEEMEAIYSRSQTQIGTDILMPSLISFLRRCGKKATVYMMPQADYSDSNLPKNTELDLYLEQFYQNDVELGKSMAVYGDTNLQQKLEMDTMYYEDYLADYQIGALYTDDYEELRSKMNASWATDLHTVVTNQEDDEDTLVIDCLSDRLTEQKIVSDASTYTFSEDLEMRSLQSVLGYSNVLFDFGKVYWPEQENDHWEILSEKLYSVANTYWKPFQVFDQTTASEADERIRNYYNTGCTYEVNGSTITATLTDNSGEAGYHQPDCWFVLRTHNQQITQMYGGEYTEIESDAYLIHATEYQFTINLENNDLVDALSF